MNEIIRSFNSFYRDFKPTDWHHWAYPVLSLLLVWIFAVLILKLFIKPKFNSTIKRPFYIFKSLYIAVCVVTGLVVLSVCFWWAKGYYSQVYPIQFSQLLTIILLAVFGIIIQVKLRNFFSQDTLTELVKQPISEYEQTNIVNLLKKEFNKNRLWLILPIASFLAVFLFLQFKSKVLISIVMDNSGSMASSDAMKYGQDALNKTFSTMSDKYTQVVISSFPDEEPKESGPFKNFGELVKTTNPSQVRANTTIASTLIEASNLITNLPGDKEFGLNNAMWNNYLTSKQLTEAQPINERVMLIISDGMEFSSEWYGTNTLCTNADFDEFYEGKVFWIDLLNRESLGSKIGEILNMDGFSTMMHECYDAQIYNGFTMEDYNIALGNIMNEFELNYMLIYFALGIVLIFALVMFLLTPPSIIQR
jgi:hypothetical protein